MKSDINQATLSEATSIEPLSPLELLELFDTSLGATVSVLNRDFRFRYVNAGFAQAFDMSPRELLGKSVHDVYGDAQYAAIEPYLLRALAGETVNYERRGRMRLVESIWRTVSFVPWLDADGQVIGIVHSSLAVHELKASTEALRAANERLSNHMDNSPLAVLELDAHLNVTHASAQVNAMLGLDPEALRGQPLLTALEALGARPEGAQLSALQLAFARLQTGTETRNRVESSHVRASGSLVHCEWFNSALTDSQGQVTSIMSLVEDVSARVEAQAQLRKLALHDPLTGLSNRNALYERLIAALARTSRSHHPLALLFIDLDGFKKVNDDFGHSAGDEVLRQVAGRLLQAVRETDVVARFGGDEFVVLLDTEVQATTPDLICERLLSALHLPCPLPQGQATVGASIGIALHQPVPHEPHTHHTPDSAHEANALIKRADAAMFEAKRAGRGCIRYAPDFTGQTGL